MNNIVTNHATQSINNKQHDL